MDGSNIGLFAYGWRVALVFALLFLAVYGLRRWGGTFIGTKSPRGYMHIVESLPVGPQRYLHIVEVDGRRYLIGVTPQSFSFIAELESFSRRAPKEEPTS